MAAVEQNLASLVSADEVAEALEVSDATPAMGVERNYVSRRNASVKNSDTLVFQQ